MPLRYSGHLRVRSRRLVNAISAGCAPIICASNLANPGRQSKHRLIGHLVRIFFPLNQADCACANRSTFGIMPPVPLCSCKRRRRIRTTFERQSVFAIVCWVFITILRVKQRSKYNTAPTQPLCKAQNGMNQFGFTPIKKFEYELVLKMFSQLPEMRNHRSNRPTPVCSSSCSNSQVE